jgi:hypothetical protein
MEEYEDHETRRARWKSMGPGKDTLKFSLGPDQRRLLTQVSRRTGMTFSAIIRKALGQYLDKECKEGPSGA